MFPIAKQILDGTLEEGKKKEKPLNNKYKSIMHSTSSSSNYTKNSDIEMDKINNMLELEQQSNKLSTWNKINKTTKIQKLHSFAEIYAKEHNLPIKDVKLLKMFFTDCLEKGKLSKTKEVVYDKVENKITSIPSLFFNLTTKSFTLKNLDNKRLNTLKSLTLKVANEEQKEEQKTP